MNARGFTFLELLVVMLLIAISSSLVYLSVGRSVAQKEGRLFASEMMGVVKKARSASISTGRPVAFCISSQDRFCWVEGRQVKLDIPEKIRVQQQGMANIDNDVYAIYFYPDGSSSGGEVTLAVGNKPFFVFRVDILTGIVTTG